MKRKGPTNPNLQELIKELKTLSIKEKVNIWKTIALELEKPTRRRRKVNLYKINKFTNENETALIPGKVLSVGSLNKEITVAAFQFSEAAKKKIPSAISIKELMHKNPKGKNIRIIC